MADRPLSSASLNSAGESPNGETTPMPVIAIGPVTTRTLPFRIVKVQRYTRFRRIAIITLVAASHLAGSTFSSSGSSARDLFDELYERGQKQNAGLKTLTASFTETSTSSLLVKPLVERGTVVVERPSRVALRYTDPSPRVVVIDGDRMIIAWPSAGIRNARDIGDAQKRIQKYFIDSSPGELRGHFQIAAREAIDRPGTYLVTMVPKRKQIQEGLARLELWVDRTSLLLSAMRMTFPGGESKVMTFDDVKPNAPIDPSLFRVE
jgi:outer membrane lipoprotein-sorting protein